MFSPSFALLDLVSNTSIVLLAAISTVLMSVAPEADYAELKLLLVPLMGGVFTCWGAILLNPEQETRRIVVGRALIGICFGCPTPLIVGYIYSPIQSLFSHAIVLMPAGGLATAFFYILSRLLFARAYLRSRFVAAALVARGEQALQLVVGKAVKENVGILNDPDVTNKAKEILSTAAETAKTVLHAAAAEAEKNSAQIKP